MGPGVLQTLARIPAPGTRPKGPDARVAALAVALGAFALVAIALTTVLAPVDPLLALPVGRQWSTTAGIVFFTILTLVASTVTADAPAGWVWVASTAPICAAAALGGPAAGAWVALIGSTERRELARGFPWYGLLCNHAVLTLAAVAAGFGAAFVRASSLTSAIDQTLLGVLAVAIAGVVYIVVSDFLGGLAVAIRQRRSVTSSIWGAFTIDIPEHGADVAFAILMATTYSSVAWWLTAVFLVPILSVMLGARRYQMAWHADHDPLTGAILRRELDRRLASIVAGAARSTRKSGILVVDVDRFKGINDTLGHEAGDRVLREVVARLSAGVRPADTVARTGGDEFVILLPGIGDESTLLARAEALATAVVAPMEIGGHTLRVGLSIGGVLVPRDTPRPSDLLSSADAAMYEAKRSGGGCRLHRALSSGV